MVTSIHHFSNCVRCAHQKARSKKEKDEEIDFRRDADFENLSNVKKEELSMFHVFVSRLVCLHRESHVCFICSFIVRLCLGLAGAVGGDEESAEHRVQIRAHD